MDLPEPKYLTVKEAYDRFYRIWRPMQHRDPMPSEPKEYLDKWEDPTWIVWNEQGQDILDRSYVTLIRAFRKGDLSAPVYWDSERRAYCRVMDDFWDRYFPERCFLFDTLAIGLDDDRYRHLDGKTLFVDEQQFERWLADQFQACPAGDRVTQIGEDRSSRTPESNLPVHGRKISPEKLDDWYEHRVRTWTGRPPSRDQDWDDAKADFPNNYIPRDAVRIVRDERAPENWKKRGRRKEHDTAKSKMADETGEK